MGLQRGVIISNLGLLVPTWLKHHLKLKVSATVCAQTKSWDISLNGDKRFIKIHNILATRSHAQLISSFPAVIKTLWTFFGPWGRDCSQLPPC